MNEERSRQKRNGSGGGTFCLIHVTPTAAIASATTLHVGDSRVYRRGAPPGGIRASRPRAVCGGRARVRAVVGSTEEEPCPRVGVIAASGVTKGLPAKCRRGQANGLAALLGHGLAELPLVSSALARYNRQHHEASKADVVQHGAHVCRHV